MVSELKLIIGLLSGSLGTLIIREIINQINKNIDFNRDLKKLTFIRKLEKAEKAVGFYSGYLTTLIEMKKSLEFLVKNLREDKDFDMTIVQELLKQQSNKMIALMEHSYPESTAVNLYFELEDLEKWNEEDVTELLASLSETKTKDNEIGTLLNFYNMYLKKGDKDKAEFYWEKVEEKIPNYSTSIERVIKSLEKNRLASYEIIRKIKSQL